MRGAKRTDRGRRGWRGGRAAYTSPAPDARPDTTAGIKHQHRWICPKTNYQNRLFHSARVQHSARNRRPDPSFKLIGSSHARRNSKLHPIPNPSVRTPARPPARPPERLQVPLHVPVPKIPVPPARPPIEKPRSSACQNHPETHANFPKRPSAKPHQRQRIVLSHDFFAQWRSPHRSPQPSPLIPSRAFAPARGRL